MFCAIKIGTVIIQRRTVEEMAENTTAAVFNCSSQPFTIRWNLGDSSG